jgi:hypothetical protein
MSPSPLPTPRSGNAGRQSLDPFIHGVVTGAIAAILGFLIGVAYFLLS